LTLVFIVARDRAKAEKLRKFQEKQQKNNTAPAAKTKEKKPKAVVEQIPEYVEETPKGQKKILKPLDDVFRKAYIPKVVESAWNDWWEKEGFFQPELVNGKVKPAGYFVIPIPPPNVTGALHIGHALANSLQDALIRWHRMRGYTTLFVPGCDHAGISTQSVVENILWRREKKTRHDLGRPELVNRIWAWKGDYHNRINTVLRRLGGSYGKFSSGGNGGKSEADGCEKTGHARPSPWTKTYQELYRKPLFVFTKRVSFTGPTVWSTGVLNYAPPCLISKLTIKNSRGEHSLTSPATNARSSLESSHFSNIRLMVQTKPSPWQLRDQRPC